MRSRPRGSASTRSRKLPDQRKPSLRSKKENPPGPVETPATGPAAGPLSYPDAKIVTANGASRPSAPAINPDERSGLDQDILVLGDDRAATDLVQALADRIPGVRGVYGGRLRNCRQIESLTANLVSINRRYKAQAGLRITDI